MAVRARGQRLVGHGFRTPPDRGGDLEMLKLALIFLVIGLIAALFGFTSVAGASFAIAKFFAFLFLVLFLIFLILGLTAARKIMT
jgi:uncharacterized membrane protein YtjA (UPF0391 family)